MHYVHITLYYKDNNQNILQIVNKKEINFKNEIHNYSFFA